MPTKKRTRRSSGGRRRRKSSGTRALSITAVGGILFVLWRTGLLSQAFWTAVMAGDLKGAAKALEDSLKAGSTSAELAITISGAVALVIAGAAIRWATKGKSVPLRRVNAITA